MTREQHEHRRHARLAGYAFQEQDCNRVILHCAAANLKSRAVAERLGFSQEGVFARSRMAVRPLRRSGRVLDAETYVGHAPYGAEQSIATADIGLF